MNPKYEEEYELLSEKIARLRKVRIIETDAATLFKLNKQIEAAERQQAQLEEELAGTWVAIIFAPNEIPLEMMEEVTIDKE